VRQEPKLFKQSPEHLGTMICEGTIMSGIVFRGMGTGTGSSFSMQRWAWSRAVVMSCSSFLSDRPSQPATATKDEEPAVFQIRNETNSDKENITFLGKSVIFGIMKINSVLLNFFCTFSWPFFLCNNLYHKEATAMMYF